MYLSSHIYRSLVRNLYWLISFLLFSGCDVRNEVETEVELWGQVYSIENTIEIDLSDNQIDGNIPADIGKLRNLISLKLFNNNLIGEIPVEIGNLKNLEYLSINNNNLSGTLPTEVGNLKNLSWLSLYKNHLSGQIPSAIGRLEKLTWLNLNQNNFSGPIPAEICEITGASVFLSNNALCPPYPDCLIDVLSQQDTVDCN